MFVSPLLFSAPVAGPVHETLSLVPGILVVCLLGFGLKATPARGKRKELPPLRWSVLDHRLRGLILAAGGLALANAPEAFLVLWARAQGLRIAWIPLLWAAASAVKAVVAGPSGSLSDRFGRFPVLLSGWSCRILLLLALAWSSSDAHPATVWPFFLAYAASLAATEGAERALIGDFARPKERATAFGLYHMVTGLAALPGALLFGVIWQTLGPVAAFAVNAILSTGAVILLQWQYRR